MKHNFIWPRLSIFFLLSATTPFAGAQNREYPCFRFTRTPVVDGRLDNDPAWTIIPATTGFLKLDKELLVASKQTSLKIGYTENALYMGIVCEDPEISEVKAQGKDMEQLWLDDSVEVFIFPKGSEGGYQLVVNSIGSRWHKAYTKRAAPTLDDWEAAAHRGEADYAIEIKLPFEFFGRSPKDKEVWIGNVGRNIHTSGDKLSSWSHLEKRFHERARFGSFVFEGNSLTPTQVTALEATLTAAYPFMQEIENLLKPLSVYQDEWRQLSKGESFGKKASGILEEYVEIKKKLSSPNSIGLKGMPQLLEASKACLRKADELEARIILEELFQE